MAGRKDFVLRGAGIVAVAGVLAGGGTYVIGGGGSPGTANVWVDSNGGTCTRSSSAVAYVDASACSTFNAAWDAMTAGDTARVKNGTYAHQCITGNKGSDTKIIGESQAGVVVSPDGTECQFIQGGENGVGVTATHFWLEDVTIDTQTSTGIGIGVRSYSGSTNTTLKNVLMPGEHPSVRVEADDFTWNGGELGNVDVPVGSQDEMTCTNGAWIPFDTFAARTLMQGITVAPFRRQEVATPNTGSCAEDGLPHIELVRPWGGADDFTMRNNNFRRGSENGSGTVWGSATISNFTAINNFFGGLGDNNGGDFVLRLGAVTTVHALYNTFEGNLFLEGGGGYVLSGNLGETSLCGTNTKNVWLGSGSCGTDTFLGSDTLDVNDDGTLQAGSPAIDAAETPGASDFCTDAAYVNSLDFLGGVRPNGSVCDAGADKR